MRSTNPNGVWRDGQWRWRIEVFTRSGCIRLAGILWLAGPGGRYSRSGRTRRFRAVSATGVGRLWLLVLALAWQTSSADELVTGNLSLFRPSRMAIDFNPGEWRIQPIYDCDAPQARGDGLLGLPHLPSAVDLIGGRFRPLRRWANAASHGNQLDYSMLERGTHGYQESSGTRRDQKQEGRNKRLTARLSWSAALTVVCGSAAWWSSEQAEHAYRRYLQAAGVRRQQQQFSRARQFDRLAGVAFIGMEAGVALVTWQLFF